MDSWNIFVQTWRLVGVASLARRVQFLPNTVEKLGRSEGRLSWDNRYTCWVTLN